MTRRLQSFPAPRTMRNVQRPLTMKFYLDAAVIGGGISIVWIVWLFAARATLRRHQLRPGYILSVVQIALVLALMLAGFKLSDHFLDLLGRAGPSDTILFRRIWIAIWALAMIGSIQIFLDIRRMAMPGPDLSRTSVRRTQPPKRSRPRRTR